MAKKKLLDLNGVQRYDTKIKEYIELREDFFRIASGISGTAASTTSGSYRSSLWNGSNPNITTLKHGMTISYRIPVAGNGTYGTLLSINGGDYYPVCANVTTMVSTRYPVGCYVLLTFDSGQTGQICYSANTKYTASATGTGLSKPGCWKIADYDTNTTAIVNTYSQYKRPYAGTSAITRYKLVVEGADNRIYPIATGDNSGTTKTPIAVSFRPEHIYYYNTGSTTSANAAIAVNSLYVTAANTTPRWTFNESIPTHRNIYLAGDLDSDTGLFKLNDAGVANSTAYYRLVPTNSSSVDYSSLGFIAGKYYVYVGASYSTANYFQLETEHPIYYFDGTNLVPTVARAEQAIKKIPTKTSQLTNDSGFITGYTNTHRDIQVNGTSIGTSATTLNLTGGTAITISNSNGKVTIAHADTSSQATTSNTGRTYIQNIGLDALGHITGVTVATETVTNTHNSHALNVTNGTATAGGSSITYVESVSGCAATSGNLSATTVRKTVTIPSIPDKNVTYSGTVANNGVAVFSGTTGIIKDSGFTIAKSVPSNAVFTDTHRAIGMNETEVLGNNTTKLTLSAGTNVTLSNPSTGVITISATDTNTHNSHALNVTNGTASQVAQGTEITFVESVSGCAATSGNLSANTVRKKVTIPDVSSFITGITNNVVYSGSPVNNQIAVFSGTTGIVKPSGYTIAKSVPSDAVFTDTHNKHSIAVTNGTASAGGATITYVESGSGGTASDGNLALTLTRKTVTIPTVPANTVTGANLSADTIILGNGSSTIKTSNKTITTTLGSDDTTVPTSKAVETAISSALASGVKYRGDFNASTGAISGSTTMTSLKESVGDMFVVSTAGKFAGTDMEVGDSIIFKKNVAAGTAVAATDITYVEGTVSVVTGTTAVTWDTEATLATVEGVAIKIKIPANPNTHNSHALNVTNGTATAGGSSITYVESVSGCAATSGNLSASTVRKTVTIPTVPSKIVTYSGTPVDNQVLVFSGTTGIAKPSGYTIAKSVPSNAVFTDTKVTSAANHYGYSDTSGKTNGLYKITVDKAGHVTSASAVQKSDITALGIPGSDTNTWRKVQVNGTDILGNGTSTNPLNLSAGTNVTLNNTNGTVTISATDTNTHRSVNMNGTEVLGNNTTALTLSAGTNVTLSNPSTGVIAISATDTNTHNKHSIVVTNGTATAGGTSITYVESGTGGTASDGNLTLTLTRKTVTIPTASDTKVRQSISSTDTDFPILVSAVKNPTGTAQEALYDGGFKINPYKHSIMEGPDTRAIGNYSHAEGRGSIASGICSHAEGSGTTASGSFSHAEGSGTTAIGQSSHAEGYGTTASGQSSHAEGYLTTASGSCAHAEGINTTASSESSHAEGSSTTAIGGSSHAEGLITTASGGGSHAEGDSTKAIGDRSHAEGWNTTASGISSHAEGYGTTASGQSSHAEGYATTTSGDSSHAEGYATTTSNETEHAEGRWNVSHKSVDWYGHLGNTQHSVGIGKSTTNRKNAFEITQNGDAYLLGVGGYIGTDTKVQDATIKTLQEVIAESSGSDEKVKQSTGNTDADFPILVSAAQNPNGTAQEALYDTGFKINPNKHSIMEGNGNTASGYYSHAEGQSTTASSNSSHAEGSNTVASGSYSHAEGINTTASGAYGSHAEGSGTTASGWYSHTEGLGTTASGDSSHAEGGGTKANGGCAHAEGSGTTASGYYSHAEGNNTKASAWTAHAEGQGTTASGYYSHAEGNGSTASGSCAHAEGYYSNAIGDYSHAEGQQTTASVNWTHAEGYGTTASGEYAHSEGQETTASFTAAHAEGVGTTADNEAAHAEGLNTIASGPNSHTSGEGTKAACVSMTAIGRYNATSGSAGNYQTLFVIGNGADSAHTSDAMIVDKNSNITISGGLKKATGGSSTTVWTTNGGTAAIPTDTKVKQSTGNTNAGFPILVSASQNPNGTAQEALYDTDFKINPSKHSIMEGPGAVASGSCSHAEGSYTKALGDYSHAEGSNTTASGECSHAEGQGTTASGECSHAEGSETTASGDYSHAEGLDTTASGDSSHAEGQSTTASGRHSHAGGFGYQFDSTQQASLSAKTSISANGNASFVHGYAEDDALIATREYASGAFAGGHAYGSNDDHIASITASNAGGFAFGNAMSGGQIVSSGYGCTSIGWAGSISDYPGTGKIIASNMGSIAVGYANGNEDGDATIISEGQGSFAGGYVYGNETNQANGSGSFAYGNDVHAYGTASHAEGYQTIASGACSHAEGSGTTAKGASSHAEGDSTVALGNYSHAEGSSTRAYGTNSFAGGLYAAASGNTSFAFGDHVTATTENSFVVGMYNGSLSSNDLFVVGTGRNLTYKTSAFKVSYDSSATSGIRPCIVTVNGKINASSGFYQTSDINKKNIEGELDLDKAYDLIDKCQTILYTLKDDESKKQEIGLIAQEVQEFFPELISKDTEGNLSLDYSRLTVVILRVLKDLIKRISKLENKE